MSNESENRSPVSLAKRKERLLREGAAYRAAIQQARTVVSHNMHADVLARSVVAQVKSNVYATLGNLVQLKGSNLQKLLPVALTALSLARKTKLLFPLLRAGVVLGAIGVGVSLVARRKRRKQIDAAV